MGDVPAGHISKGVIHAKVDALVNHQDVKGTFDKRAAFLASMRAATTPEQYLSLLKTQAGVSESEAAYLNDYFYEPGERWWENLQPIFPILRQGLIKALEEAADSLPLDSYWLPAAGNQTVEVIVCKSSTQVTRIFLTPPPGDGPMGSRHTDAPIWEIRAQADPGHQVGFATTDAVVRKVEDNVVTWQRREFP